MWHGNVCWGFYPIAFVLWSIDVLDHLPMTCCFIYTVKSSMRDVRFSPTLDCVCVCVCPQHTTIITGVSLVYTVQLLLPLPHYNQLQYWLEMQKHFYAGML